MLYCATSKTENFRCDELAPEETFKQTTVRFRAIAEIFSALYQNSCIDWNWALKPPTERLVLDKVGDRGSENINY